MKIWSLGLCFLLALGASACSTIKDAINPPGIKLDWDSVSLYIDPAANRNFPVAVDVVLVFEEDLAKKIATLKAGEWFAARSNLQKANPGEIEFVSVELAPGETLSLPGKRFSGKRVFVALAFADYFSAGEHKVRLDSLKGRLSLEFGATDFSALASEK
jgi:type VI secretion system protein